MANLNSGFSTVQRSAIPAVELALAAILKAPIINLISDNSSHAYSTRNKKAQLGKRRAFQAVRSAILLRTKTMDKDPAKLEGPLLKLICKNELKPYFKAYLMFRRFTSGLTLLSARIAGAREEKSLGIPSRFPASATG